MLGTSSTKQTRPMLPLMGGRDVVPPVPAPSQFNHQRRRRPPPSATRLGQREGARRPDSLTMGSLP
ncbi:hypothetical protein B0I35DRAFT_429255 [Stachybotrys elegans]|uniref:Uncharacterized protein n=1 Tax=Stachybotrys elegans TaxID=80388 RepID=A0A8K0WU94_9HYPO|nr:hypothetical protein B0I35DRAFT_429255 [Stachybotrys elegans]